MLQLQLQLHLVEEVVRLQVILADITTVSRLRRSKELSHHSRIQHSCKCLMMHCLHPLSLGIPFLDSPNFDSGSGSRSNSGSVRLLIFYCNHNIISGVKLRMMEIWWFSIQQSFIFVEFKSHDKNEILLRTICIV